MKTNTDTSTLVLPSACRCENCRFWQEDDPDEHGGRTGRCVRHAPVFIGLDEDKLPRFAQPTTGVRSTCGEWENIVESVMEDGRIMEGSFRWIFPAPEGAYVLADKLEPAPF